MPDLSRGGQIPALCLIDQIVTPSVLVDIRCHPWSAIVAVVIYFKCNDCIPNTETSSANPVSSAGHQTYRQRDLVLKSLIWTPRSVDRV